MRMQLIITEKPSAAKRMANALADGKVSMTNNKGVKTYELTHDGKKIVVVGAVGHLFTVAEKKKSFKYPSYDIERQPVYKVEKGAGYAKKYAEAIKNQAKKADSYVVACDYDIEGEVIGLNAVRFLCGKDDAKRMKFSTLTKSDLLEAYDNMSETLDWGQAKAGEARHFLDWMYGINLSRALTLAIKKNNAYRTMSAGRVQGPALKIIVDKEKEIMSFKPKKYWELQLLGKAKGHDIEAWHEKKKFWNEEPAQKIYEKVKGHDGTVKKVTRSQRKQPPPYPFDLTTLQTEAYRHLRIRPKTTLDVAQSLYSRGYISYPRTSSQQLPEKIGFSKILGLLNKQEKYKKHVKIVSSGALKPNNGKKKDPAHPAIYPTGVYPKKMNDLEKKLYDLVVKRFFATFGEWAVRERNKLTIDVNSENFVASGVRTTKKGWHMLYEPYVKFKEVEIPPLEESDTIEVKKLNKLEKETLPPKRYTQASIINELEKRDLGTKATRAQVIESLYDREYITGKSIEATKLGMKTIETLEEHVPKIVDEELTQNFEAEMEKIRNKETEPKDVLQRAKKELNHILEEFKDNEKEIGKKLLDAYRETEKEKNYIGKCPKCKKGDLSITYSRRNKQRFIACDAYPDCKNTFSIPQTGPIESTDKTCPHCSHPIIKIGKKKQEVCINMDCPGKEEEAEKGEEIIEENAECPKCKGELVVRKSIYGSFLGCSNYPKCKYTKKITS